MKKVAVLTALVLGAIIGAYSAWRGSASAVTPKDILAEHEKSGIYVLIVRRSTAPTVTPRRTLALRPGDLRVTSARKMVATTPTFRCRSRHLAESQPPGSSGMTASMHGGTSKPSHPTGSTTSFATPRSSSTRTTGWRPNSDWSDVSRVA